MTEAEWLVCSDMDLLWHACGREHSDRKYVLFAAACCSLLKGTSNEETEDDLRYRARLKVVEGFADGAVPRAEMRRLWGHPDGGGGHPERAYQWASAWGTETRALPDNPPSELIGGILRDIFGNPFRPVTFPISWRTSTTVALARQMYESRDFGAMPILADALQDAGCESADVLDHCRGDGSHVRGCWVVDLVLGKE